MVGQIPSLIGVEAGSGNFFPRVADLLGELGDAHGATVAVGVASLAVLLALGRFAPARPRDARRARARDRRLGAVGPVRPRGRGRRFDPRCAPRSRLAGREHRRRGRAPPGGLRRADPLHRGGRRVALARHRAPLHGRPEPRPVGDGRVQHPRGAFVRFRAVRRREPDRGGRPRRRPYAARHARDRGPRPAHGRVPRARVQGPAAGDAGGDRDRGRLELPARRRAAALRGAAPQRDRARAAGARGRARTRRAPRADRHRGALAGARHPAHGTAARRGARPRPGVGSLVSRRAP